jgi:hypothetical protein
LTAVVVETSSKRTFASASDWPGWSRSGRTEEDALRALVDYGPRYATVAQRAGLEFVAPNKASDVKVARRVKGGSGTDFGVPSSAWPDDDRRVDDRELARQVALLEAAWAVFDETARAARGAELRKGPRGGGRDLDKIVDHVIEAEEAYLGQLGARPPKRAGDRTKHVATLRTALLEALDARMHGRALKDPRNTKNPWTTRYTVRRTVWHALDHAWEIEDRAVPEPKAAGAGAR